MKLKNSIFKESISKSILCDSVISDAFLYKNIDATINKWLNLQKIIKESQSLEKIIEKQHTENLSQLKKDIHSYYNLKLKTRKLFNDIKNLKIRTEWVLISEKNEYYLTEATGTYFGNAVAPIKNLISIIRDNYDYIPIIVSLIDENDTKQEIESLAEFFCNQFYTNILIPNPEQEELLICIYKLLEYEINKMDIADVESFLDDSTFIGKMLTAFSKNQELNNFLVNLLSKVLNEIDKRNNTILDLSLNEMIKFIKRKRKENGNKIESKPQEEERYTGRLSYCFTFRNSILSDQKTDKVEKILEKIPNTKINFKKQKVLEEELFRESIFSDNETNFTSTILYDEDDDLSFDQEDECKENKINSDYSNELTEQILIQRMKNTSNPDLVSFYTHLIKELNETYHNSYAFGNHNFFQTFYQGDFKQEKNSIIKMYLKNFLFIQEQVEEIIQSLIDKISAIPYAVRCICTMIDILILRKFPLIPKYFRHSFIGKFLFNKCIFPVLSLENANGLKTNLFSRFQMSCLKCIISVISNANMCKLFDMYNDVNKTMFNYYLLEIIPILNKFYDNLVDMTLPSQLTEIIEQSLNNQSIKEEISFSSNENTPEIDEKKTNKINNIKNASKKDYYYFKENTNELIRLKTVCFNEKDIIFITELISKNTDAFKNLPDFDRVKKAMKERDIRDLEEIIDKQKENRVKKKLENTRGEGYYIFFYEEKNEILKEFENIISNKENAEDKSLLSKMKNSIKTILKRLNLLNIKQYSYLNFATSNEKFFLAINYTLKDFESDDFNDNKVPLNWHSKFIVNNLKQLEQKYTANDFEKLYEEIYNEENELLNKLKSLSPILNARETMNLSCAENAIENIEYQINNLEKTKKLEKVKVFIDNDNTEVCLQIYIDKNQKITRTKTDFDKSKTIKRDKYIKLTTSNECYHRANKFINEMQGKNNIKVSSHAKGIVEFIKKFRKSEGNFAQLKKFIEEDIETGKTEHKIFMLFEDYKMILRDSLKGDNFNYLIKDIKENEIKEILNKIEDYFLQRTYQYVFPKEPLIEDRPFHELTKSYDWIPSTYFGVKVNLPLEAIQDCINYVKLMEEKAFSINEKMKYFKMILNNLNKINEFYCGESGKTADDQTPIYTYIILKSHPKRFISNINYVKCFTDGKAEKDPVVELFKNNSLLTFTKIWNITPTSLNMTAEEFNRRNSEANNRFSII